MRKIAIAILLFFCSNCLADVNDGIYRLWKFTENDGNKTFADSVIPGLTLTTSSTSTSIVSVAGKIGQGVINIVDGNYYTASVDSASALPSTTAFWFKINSLTDAYVGFLGNYSAGDVNSNFSINYDGFVNISYYGKGTYIANDVGNLIDSNWHLLVFVYDGGGAEYCKLKIDDIGRSIALSGVVNNPADTNFGVCRHPNSDYDANFVIDEVAFWSRKISDAEANDLWNDSNGISLIGGSVTYRTLVVTNGTGSGTYPDGYVASIVMTIPSCDDPVNWTGTAVDAGKVADPNAATTTVTMDANYTVVANFTPSIIEIMHYTKIDTNEPVYRGLVNISTCPSNMSIIGGVDSRFLYWTGTAVDLGYVSDPNDPNIAIVAYEDCNLIANYIAGSDIFTLVTASDANGSVTTPGEGLFFYLDGAVVNLVATPLAGYKFSIWTGDTTNIASINAASTTITMNDDAVITANFTLSKRRCCCCD